VAGGEGGYCVTLRPYQQKVVDWACTNDKGIVIAPPGSGKTIIAAAICSTHWSGAKIGWLAPTKETCAQAVDALKSFNIHPSQYEVRCYHESVDFSDREVIIVDECKHASARVLKDIIVRSQCDSVYGFDGTPFGDNEERNEELLALFGHSTITITRDEVGSSLSKAKVVLSDATDQDLEGRINQNIEKLVKVRSRFMRIPEGEIRAMAAWESIVDIGICQNNARNYAALNFCLAHADKQVLVLVPRITLGEKFEAKIPDSTLVHAKIGKLDRKRAMDDFKAGKLKCMIATTLADEGLDLPNASHLVMVSGGRSTQRTTQRTARVLRAFQGKTHATILDFVDSFHPLAFRHALRRREVYKELGYEIG